MSVVARDVELQNIIIAIPSDEVFELWKHVKEMLYPAVERSRGRWSMQTLLIALKEGKQQLWVIFEEGKKIKGVATTEILSYPNKKMLAIQYLGGNDLETWGISYLKRVEEFARAAKCEGIEATGRKGLWKWFKEDDYKDTYTVYEKEID
tara:strand:- start:693 stop:1142 length:450 start_codon:yes stop_codon:yes gene_type:complete